MASTDTDTLTGPDLTLSALDARLGSLIVGERSVHRARLVEMGARVNGEPLSAAHVQGREADQALIDSIRFPAHELKAQADTVGTTSDSTSDLLFEFASLRSTHAPPLLSVAQGADPDAALNKLDGLLRAVQRTRLDPSWQAEGLPPWVDVKQSQTLSLMGAGLAVYGYYSAINALVRAIKDNDFQAIFTSGAELLVELTSNALELALESLGKRMMENGGRVFHGFSSSAAGKLLSRGAGLFALVLTLPFDISNAIASLEKAARSQGKEAIDHYVSAGFSLASAALGVVLGVAALAGFTAAGPLGMAAAVVLIFGAQIYGAVRQVDEIDDYIELSAYERLRTGWLSFIGEEVDKDVSNRYLMAKMEAGHAAHLQSQAQGWLQGELKKTLQAVVNGKFVVRMTPVRYWKHQWEETLGEPPYVDTLEPVISETDDVIDASCSRRDPIPGLVEGEAGPGKSYLWRLGGGNDRIKGLCNTPNIFQFGAGVKSLTGAEVDDQFVFDIPGGTYDGTVGGTTTSELLGGEGSDTLQLLSRSSFAEGTQGYSIDLAAGTVVLLREDRQANAHRHLTLDSIENVITPANVSSHVKGSAQANTVVAHGNNDRIEAGAGDDTIIVMGTDCWVDGGAGKDRYVIADNRGVVTLDEQDWTQDTVIEMHWDMAMIAGWFVRDCALVIVSLRGVDGELPEREVRIENLYSVFEGKRVLRQHGLRFFTADGYTLAPGLEPELTLEGDYQVRVVVRAMQQDITFDNVLDSGELKVPYGRSTHCFVARGPAHKQIRVSLKSDVTACTLYLDYTSGEILDVSARYRVTCRRAGHFDRLTYSDVALTISLVDTAQLQLLHYASDRITTRSNVAADIMAARLTLDCRFVLVMRDGVSYRVHPPGQSYLEDRSEPAFKTFDGRHALLPRQGAYPFFRPQPGKPIWLQSTPQRVTIAQPPHRQSYALVGRGSVYEVCPSPGATIHLSTPGALAKTSDASFWQINTMCLPETIGRLHIVLTHFTLRVGSVTLVLPEVSDPRVPLEQVSIQTVEGDRYDIRTDFGAVYLAQIDASQYSTIDAVWAQLQRRRQESTLMVRRLRVTGVRLASGVESNIYYDAWADCWGAESAEAGPVASTDLRLVSSV